MKLKSNRARATRFLLEIGAWDHSRNCTANCSTMDQIVEAILVTYGRNLPK